jgi:hypothetical protein
MINHPGGQHHHDLISRPLLLCQVDYPDEEQGKTVIFTVRFIFCYNKFD